MGGYEAKERKIRGKVQIFLERWFILPSEYVRIARNGDGKQVEHK